MVVAESLNCSNFVFDFRGILRGEKLPCEGLTNFSMRRYGKRSPFRLFVINLPKNENPEQHFVLGGICLMNFAITTDSNPLSMSEV